MTMLNGSLRRNEKKQKFNKMTMLNWSLRQNEKKQKFDKKSEEFDIRHRDCHFRSRGV